MANNNIQAGGIQVELWSDIIMENLFQNNEFMYMGIDDSKFVSYLGASGDEKSAAVVSRATAGSVPLILLNPTYPLTISARTDSNLFYNIQNLVTQPWTLAYSDAVTVLYDKASNLLKEMNEQILEAVGNNTAYQWAIPVNTGTTAGVNLSSRVIRTTGPGDTACLSSGATGSRSAITLYNIAQAKSLLDSDKFPASERYMVMPSSMWDLQVLQLANIVQYLQSGSKSALRVGQLDPNTIPAYAGTIYGFNVITRPQVVSYATTSGGTVTLNPIGANGVQTTSNTTDELGAIFFHKSAVSNAIGKCVLFFEPVRSEYQGSLMSSLIRWGASPTYSTSGSADYRGMGAIVQQ